jgi:hypothetical protein
VTRLAPGYGEHRFGDTRVVLSPAGADVVMPDGGEVCARPARTGAGVVLSVRLGYDGDTAAMCREYCFLHAALSHALGLPHSPTLAGLAHNAGVSELTRAESEMVAAAQRFLNLWRSGARE